MVANPAVEKGPMNWQPADPENRVICSSDLPLMVGIWYHASLTFSHDAIAEVFLIMNSSESGGKQAFCKWGIHKSGINKAACGMWTTFFFSRGCCKPQNHRVLGLGRDLERSSHPVPPPEQKPVSDSLKINDTDVIDEY